MSLLTSAFKSEYRTGVDNIVEALYHPALREASQYWRAVGFFSSSALEAIGEPLGVFVDRGGTMRLVTSVRLSEADLHAIETGIDRSKVIEARLLDEIRLGFSSPLGRGAFLLASLLASGRLEIQVAHPRLGAGIYHEKVGVFLDSDNNFVAFTGSSNESRTAFETNYECVDVYTSWGDPARAQAKRAHFVQLWDRIAPGVETMTFPEAARRALLVKYEETVASGAAESSSAGNEDGLWPHQKLAVREFFAKKRGVLEMATGTGKTRTALHICRQLLSTNQVDTMIVTADGNDLLDQWYLQLLTLSKTSPKPLTILRHYGSYHQTNEFELRSGVTALLVSRLALPQALRVLRRPEAARTLLIHDEVHRLGSEGNRKALAGLSDHIPYRLGLSATPDREYDQDGNIFIADHIGPNLFEYPLSAAIQDEILAPFDYFPLPYTPDANDRARLQNVYKQASARRQEGRPMSQEEIWIEIAKVYKSSNAKLAPFDEFIRAHPQLLRRCIIFVDNKEYGDSVLQLVHRYRHDFHTYYAEEDSQTLRRFAVGDLECLITCHRLSEGIDIRSLESVILFSSSRARLETIQRIGRCLRVDPDNPSKRASVVDFIRTGGAGDDDDGGDQQTNSDTLRESWLMELSRIRQAQGKGK
jgi:superfamily II DNA or RNA helicase